MDDQTLTILFNTLPLRSIHSLYATCCAVAQYLGPLISRTYWFIYDEPNKFKFLHPARFIINKECSTLLSSSCVDQITHLKISEPAFALLLGSLHTFSNLRYLILWHETAQMGTIKCPPSFALPSQLSHLQIDFLFTIPLQCLTSLPLKFLKLDQDLPLSSLPLLPCSISTLQFGKHTHILPPLDLLYSALPMLRNLQWGINHSRPASLIPPLSRLTFEGVGSSNLLLTDQVLPDTLTHISFPHGPTQQINHLLPPRLHYLYLGQYYDNQLLNLPPLLHTLIINSPTFSHSLDHLPQTLKKLKIGGSHLRTEFNLPLHHLPPSLIKLKLLHMEKYTQEIRNLPISLQKFVLTSRRQEVNITSLPSALTYLFVEAEGSTNILRLLPASLHTLKLHGRVTKDTKALLPSSLQVLKMINWEWEYPLSQLPPSLHTLSISSSSEFTQPFLLPPTVRNLTIQLPSFLRPSRPLPPLITFRLHCNSTPGLNEYLPPSLQYLSLPLRPLHTLSALPANLLHLTIVAMKQFEYLDTSSLQAFPQLPAGLARVTLSPYTHASVLNRLAPYHNRIVIRTGSHKQTVFQIIIKKKRW